MNDIWYLYILECRDSSYYIGITKDIPNRLEQHNSGKGAKYTRSHRPVKLVYFEEHDSGSKARKREREMKGWSREKKGQLINQFSSSALERFLRISVQ